MIFQGTLLSCHALDHLYSAGTVGQQLTSRIDWVQGKKSYWKGTYGIK